MSSRIVYRPLDEHQGARRYAEEAIARAIYTWPSTHTEIFTKLNPDNFYHTELHAIFAAGHAIFHQGGYVDVVSLAAMLEEQLGSRPPWFPPRFDTPIQEELNEQLDGFSAENMQHVSHWIELLLRHQKFHRFKTGAEHARTLGHMVEVASEALENDGLLGKKDEIPWDEALHDFVEVQTKIREGSVQAGHSWGIDVLDEVCLLQPGCLYIVAGIKKGAKSHFLQHTLIENAKAKNPSFFFSLEMGIRQVIRRWMAHETGINSRHILSRSVTAEEDLELRAMASRLSLLPLKVNQSPRITPAEVLARTRAWKRKDKIEDGFGVVAVDFIQLMPTLEKKGQNDATALKDVAYELARLAKETQCAVIAAAQLNNQAEGVKPQMKYLEGSGGIAQAAEAILLLDLIMRRVEGTTSALMTPLDVVVYQRNGESGRKIELMADLSTSRFKRKYG